MGLLDFPSFTSTANGPNACVVSDVVSLTPADPAQSSLISYVLTTRPSGSSATISSGGVFTPDVGGVYLVTASAGNATSATYTFFCFSSAMFASAGIGTYATGTSAGLTRPVSERRQLLSGICRGGGLTSAQFTAWVAGTFPSTLNLASCGG